MSSLLSLLSNVVIWRVISVLGVISSVLAPAVVALQVRNASEGLGTLDVDVASFNRHTGGQILSMPLRRVDHRGIATPSIAKRFFKAEVLGVFGAAYLAELTIGTSKNGKNQVVDVLIDTGSFELWVNPTCSASNVPEFCEAFGHYDPALSSTSQKVNGQFKIKYGSGQVSGEYYKDDIYISGAKVESQQFGVANKSELVWFGILGLAHGMGKGVINYPLLIDSLATEGLANTKMFSMDLGKQFSPGGAITGELVFGGVDTNKYTGLLQKVPTSLYDPHYRITLNSLAHRAPGSNISRPFIDSNLPLSVIVDSGTTLSLLPEPIVKQVAAQFPGAQSDGAGGYRVDCSYQALDGSVDFSFISEAGNTVTISVVYRDFIWNSGGDCFLGVWSSTDLGVWILGDTFLRAAYIAFDQTNNALFMSNYVSCGEGQSNLVSVPAGPDGAAKIPGSCTVVPPPAPPDTATSSATYPGGTPSDTAIPTVASTLGPTLNPVGPPPGTPSTSSGYPSSMPPATSNPAATQSLSPGDPGPSSMGAMDAMGNPEASRDIIGSDRLEAPPTTITSTITRAVVVSACPDTVVDCPFRTKPSTSFEVITTTFCPGHDEPLPAPAASPIAGGAGDMVIVTEASAPASTLVVEMGHTASGQPQPQHQQQQQQQQQEAEEEIIYQEGEWAEQAVITTAYPSTTTYEITSCAAGDSACETGMTTTRVITVAKTVVVHPVPASASASPVPSVVATTGGKKGNVSSAFNFNNTGKPAVVAISAAAPVDDAKIDKRYLGAVFALLWGVMMLL
ncbi:aspartic peptidase domain-containing protein [Xylaria sp. FL1042]|nr:aspartic peptidase domain-containing protein [Xylaria sp. FL1042]